MTTSEPNDWAAPRDRRDVTADLSWMLWTALGIGGIWVAVLLISLFAPDLVSGSEQEHFPLAAFTAWFWGGIGTMVFLWAISRVRGTALWRPMRIGLSAVTLALWTRPRSSPSPCPPSRPGPIRRRSPSPPCSHPSPRRCSPRSRGSSAACSAEARRAGSSATHRSSPTPHDRLDSDYLHSAAVGAVSVWVGAWYPWVDLVAEAFDAAGDLAHAVGVFNPVEVQALGGEGVEVDGAVDGHQRGDEQGAAAGAPAELDVAEGASGTYLRRQLGGLPSLRCPDALRPRRQSRSRWLMSCVET